MQTEQIQPPIEDDSKYGFAYPFFDVEFAGKKATRYLTDGTVALDNLFGLNIRDPFNTKEVSKYRLNLATDISAPSFESLPVINFFKQDALISNHFSAFVVQELRDAGCDEDSLKSALEDGYLRRTLILETGVELAELTPQFGHMFETAKNITDTLSIE